MLVNGEFECRPYLLIIRLHSPSPSPPAPLCSDSCIGRLPYYLDRPITSSTTHRRGDLKQMNQIIERIEDMDEKQNQLVQSLEAEQAQVETLKQGMEMLQAMNNLKANQMKPPAFGRSSMIAQPVHGQQGVSVLDSRQWTEEAEANVSLLRAMNSDREKTMSMLDAMGMKQQTDREESTRKLAELTAKEKELNELKEKMDAMIALQATLRQQPTQSPMLPEKKQEQQFEDYVDSLTPEQCMQLMDDLTSRRDELTKIKDTMELLNDDDNKEKTHTCCGGHHSHHAEIVETPVNDLEGMMARLDLLSKEQDNLRATRSNFAGNKSASAMHLPMRSASASGMMRSASSMGAVRPTPSFGMVRSTSTVGTMRSVPAAGPLRSAPSMSMPQTAATMDSAPASFELTLPDLDASLESMDVDQMEKDVQKLTVLSETVESNITVRME